MRGLEVDLEETRLKFGFRKEKELRVRFWVSLKFSTIADHHRRPTGAWLDFGFIYHLKRGERIRERREMEKLEKN